MPEPDALTIAREAEIRADQTRQIVDWLRESDASILVYDEATGGDKLADAASAVEAAFEDGLPPVADPSGREAMQEIRRVAAEWSHGDGPTQARPQERDVLHAILDITCEALADPPGQPPVGQPPGTVQTLTYRLDAGQPEQYEYRAVIGGWGSHALPSEASASVTLRNHWLSTGHDPHIERRVAGTEPGPWERLDVPNTTGGPS